MRDYVKLYGWPWSTVLWFLCVVVVKEVEGVVYNHRIGGGGVGLFIIIITVFIMMMWWYDDDDGRHIILYINITNNYNNNK